MVKRDGAFLKTQRITKIGQHIAKNISKGVDYEGLLTWIEATIGLTNMKAREYVAIACRVHAWEIKKGVIEVATE